MGNIYNECKINNISQIKLKKSFIGLFSKAEEEKAISSINNIIDTFNREALSLYNNANLISTRTFNTSLASMVESFHLIQLFLTPRIRSCICTITEDAQNIYRKYSSEFKQFINSITNNSSLSLEKIEEECSKWTENFKSYKNKMETEYKVSAGTHIQSWYEKIDLMYQGRCQQHCISLIGKCSVWTQKIEKAPKNNEEKAANLIKTLNAIKNIAKTRKGVFTKEMIEVLEDCFGNNGTWKLHNYTKKIDKKYDYFNNLETTKYMVTIMCMVIDKGCHPIKMILEYVSAS